MTIDAVVIGRDLAGLNEWFLELAAGGLEPGLPCEIVGRLQGLGGLPRRRMSSLPFALFGFGFEDEAAWGGLLAPGVRDRSPAYAACEPAVERFTLLALTVLRGFARVAPDGVSAWIGLPVGTRNRLAEQELGTLAFVAPMAASRLRGRLAHQQAFWGRLIDAAERGDYRHLGMLAAHGRQWTIRRSLGLAAPLQSVRGYRR